MDEMLWTTDGVGWGGAEEVGGKAVYGPQRPRSPDPGTAYLLRDSCHGCWGYLPHSKCSKGQKEKQTDRAECKDSRDADSVATLQSKGHLTRGTCIALEPEPGTVERPPRRRPLRTHTRMHTMQPNTRGRWARARPGPRHVRRVAGR